MKNSIKWHKESLNNRIASLERDVSELTKLQEKIDRQKKDIALYKAQIALAELEGKDSFDSNKYAIKRLVGV